MKSAEQALLATRDAVTDYGKETIQAIAEWRGRCFQNGVRNAMFGIGGVGTLVTIYEFANPLIQTTAPGWLIGAVVGGVSAVTIVGGICLWASSPPKFEQIVVELGKNLDRLEVENAKFRKNVKNFGEEVDNFEGLAENTKETYQVLEKNLDLSITAIEDLRDDFGKTNTEMKEANEDTVVNINNIESQVSRLKSLTQVFSSDQQNQDNSHYTINDQHDTIIDMGDAQTRLEAHQAYLTQWKGSGTQ